MWKKDGCGFGMIQLGFNGKSGIVSPQFSCERHKEDENKEDELKDLVFGESDCENFTTTYLKPDQQIKKISVNVSEEKYRNRQKDPQIEFLFK